MLSFTFTGDFYRNNKRTFPCIFVK